MNNKKNYKKGNRIEIIKALYACINLPYHSLELFEGEIRLIQRKVRQMEKEGLLAVQKTECGKVIELKNYMETCTDYIEHIPPSYFVTYNERLPDIRKRKNNKNNYERSLRNAELRLLMHMSEVGVYPDEKEPLKNVIILKEEEKQYYSSREIKACHKYQTDVKTEKEGIKKISGSRINGVMASPGGVYAVYHISNRLIEWERYGEVKMSQHIKRVFAEKYEIKKERIIKCLLVANEMEVFARVIMNENKKRRSTTLLNIDYAYEYMYAIPANKDGIEMIKLMQREEWEFHMQNILLANSPRKEESYSIVHDGHNEEDGYILLFCTGNLNKLKLFIKRAVQSSMEEKFTIYCFTYQVPIFQKLNIKHIKIKAMELKEYIEMESDIRKTITNNNTS